MPLTRFDPLYLETEETVRARMLGDMPDGLSREEGSFARDILEVSVLEFSRMWDELNRYAAYSFPTFAYGDLLDAHAESYGLKRSLGTKATGRIRFTAPAGTEIPPSTIVEVPGTDPDAERVRYSTVNTTTLVVGVNGYIDIESEALAVGKLYNRPAGSVALIDSPVSGVTAVTNVTPMTGGSDPEDDLALRRRVLDEVRLPVGSGSKLDYVVWARVIPGVDKVAVIPLWDTSHPSAPGTGVPNGTVALSIRDQDYTPVDWSVVQETQRYLDPSRQMIALLEDGEAWIVAEGPGGLSWVTTTVQMGASAMRVTNAAAATTVVSLAREMDLGHFDGTDDIYLWLRADNWANIAATSYIEFRKDAANYFRVTLATRSSGTSGQFPATDKPTTGSNTWWLYRVSKSQFTKTGAPSWEDIDSVRLGVVSTAAATLDADYWSIRSLSGAAGEGKAPVGAAVTVVTPVPKQIVVTVTGLVLRDGYTLLGTPGTTNITELIRSNLEDYFRTLQPGDPVRVVDVANAIHDTTGVLDFTLAAPAGNQAVTVNQYAVLGTLSLS